MFQGSELNQEAFFMGYRHGRRRARAELRASRAFSSFSIPDELRGRKAAEGYYVNGQKEGYSDELNAIDAERAALRKAQDEDMLGAAAVEMDRIEGIETPTSFNAPLAMGVAILGALLSVLFAGALMLGTAGCEEIEKTRLPTPEQIRKSNTPEQREAGDRLRQTFNGL